MKSINRLQTYVQDLTQRFQSCERGAIAIIVALAVIPMMVAGGLAVDLSRAYLTKSRLGHALDAAGLAVGSMRTTSTDSSYLETQFNSFFAANYPSTEVGTTHDITLSTMAASSPSPARRRWTPCLWASSASIPSQYPQAQKSRSRPTAWNW